MSRLRLKYLLSTAVVASVAFGVAGVASAAPVTNTVRGADVQAMASNTQVQSVHWVRRGHRRVWIPDHRRH